MENFVNRESELQLIDESFQCLLERKRLLNNPIIEVQGIRGIGKTSLLKQVEQRCHNTDLPYIWVDVSQNTTDVAHEIIAQIQRYTQENEFFLEQSPVQAMKILLQRGPVVLLFDAVETADEEQLSTIATLLRDLIDDEKLFVVLTSKKLLSFGQERTVARKLTTLPLKPLDRKNCEFYLTNLEHEIEPQIREIIFEWTRGYPLAMQVMAQAVSRGLDPRSRQDQRTLLALLTEQVINQAVLAGIKPEVRARYLAALQLFAVPRRFNLVIMQDLIETFNPELKRESSMAYFGLPKEISEATDVLSWSMLRAGFSVVEPVRHIFLLLLKTEQPLRYFAIHDFLAQTNLRLAREFVGTDRVRCLRECLYHTVSHASSPLLAELLSQTLQMILQEPPETLQQFLEEFSQDQELKETLGERVGSIHASISAQLAKVNTDVSAEGSL